MWDTESIEGCTSQPAAFDARDRKSFDIIK